MLLKNFYGIGSGNRAVYSNLPFVVIQESVKTN